MLGKVIGNGGITHQVLGAKNFRPYFIPHKLDKLKCPAISQLSQWDRLLGQSLNLYPSIKVTPKGAKLL
jgi:hypothetical protein